MSLEKRQCQPNSIEPSSLQIPASSLRTLFRVQASSPLRRHMAILNRDEVAPTIIRLDYSDLAHAPCETSLSVHSEAESIATAGQKPPGGAGDAPLLAETPSNSKTSPPEQLSITGKEGAQELTVCETGDCLADQKDDVGTTLTSGERAFSSDDNPLDALSADAVSAPIIPTTTPTTPTATPPGPCTNMEVVIIDLDSDDDDNPSGNECDLSNDDSRETEGSASVLGKRKAQLVSDDSVDAESTANSVAKTPRISTLISPATGSQDCPVELDSDSDVDSPPSPRQSTTSISDCTGVGSATHRPIIITIETIMSDDELDTSPELKDQALQGRVSKSSKLKSPLSPTNPADNTGPYLGLQKHSKASQRLQTMTSSWSRHFRK
ncbi:hypothetical protein EDD21DRAFT_152123 [Dissophora ornata]|nr:hypothetical protein EDD21DRAFT_152123 [Dissophora ornata]